MNPNGFLAKAMAQTMERRAGKTSDEEEQHEEPGKHLLVL